MSGPRVLIACEYSGRVREALRSRGVDAVSCDLLPTEQAGPHIQGDVSEVLRERWDGVIAHPPCTYLAVSGLHWNGRVAGRAEKTEAAIRFARSFIEATHIPLRATENPVGILSSRVRKPEQIVQPYDFGEDASKKTCLWLTGLPALVPTRHIEPATSCCGARFTEPCCPICERERERARRVWGNQTAGGQNKLPPSEDRWKLRSLTYQGIADAIGAQWAPVFLGQSITRPRPLRARRSAQMDLFAGAA